MTPPNCSAIIKHTDAPIRSVEPCKSSVISFCLSEMAVFGWKRFCKKNVMAAIANPHIAANRKLDTLERTTLILECYSRKFNQKQNRHVRVDESAKTPPNNGPATAETPYILLTMDRYNGLLFIGTI